MVVLKKGTLYNLIRGRPAELEYRVKFLLKIQSTFIYQNINCEGSLSHTLKHNVLFYSRYNRYNNTHFTCTLN
jgi:hypothetical protein